MLSYLYSGLVTLVVTLLAFILKNQIQENKRLKQDQAKRFSSIEMGVLSLLRAQLMEYHDKYTHQEHISTHDYENWDLMYKSYKDLGGNGMITHMADDIHKMDICD